METDRQSKGDASAAGPVATHLLPDMPHNGPDIHINLNIRGMRSSATVTINERSDQLLESGKKIVKLGLGQSPFPVPKPVVRALQENAHQKDYLPVRGLRMLREAVAEYHSRKHGINRSGDDVLIGPGSKELMFLLQLVFYGELVIPAPAWVSYAPQARIIGRNVRLIPTEQEDEWHLRADRFEALCEEDPQRPRVMILNYPSNPTGTSFEPDELEALASVARQYKVLLLSDEIYGELHHEGRHTSIATYYPEGTIISSGLSKWCGAGGWRLGTFTFPPTLRWLLDAMAVAASETYTSTSAPIQYAAVTAFQGGSEIEDYLNRSRRVLKVLGGWSVACLRQAGLKCAGPAGGFYLFPDFTAHQDSLAERGIKTAPDLCERLLEETGVAILPGSEFGRPVDELTARLAYVDFDGAASLDAMEDRVYSPDEFVHAYCNRVVRGIQHICDWVRR